jgi:hypothetical protein
LNGDGTIDRAVDYSTRLDQDVDEEQYRWHDDLRFKDDTWVDLPVQRPGLLGFWSKDIGDDNRPAYERL